MLNYMHNRGCSCKTQSFVECDGDRWKSVGREQQCPRTYRNLSVTETRAPTFSPTCSPTLRAEPDVISRLGPTECKSLVLVGRATGKYCVKTPICSLSPPPKVKKKR